MALLVALLVLSLATQKVVLVISEQTSRAREQDTLNLGVLYVLAIKSYYEASPGTSKQLPSNVDDLLEDTRYVYIRRHLRRAYKDPLSQGEGFGLLRTSNGRIEGVYSAPLATTTKIAPPQVEGVHVIFSDTTQSWQFVFVAPAPISLSMPRSLLTDKGGRS
jgi:type II secretory pathway pseudopilin PulG